VNQWVDLTNNARDTIIGSDKHFYRVNAAGSLTVSLSITSGPALYITLFDGCSNLEFGFSESQVCVDDCHIWVPTMAKHSVESVYYIEIESGSIGDGPNANTNVEKVTEYSITVKTGTANCAAPPTQGWCANPAEEGVNVWSQISHPSVWSFQDAAAKDDEAHCLFDMLFEECQFVTQECRTLLKTLTCVMTFPQCDASGFQTPVCYDLCVETSLVCGLELPCCTEFFSSSDSASCVNFPPPPPPSTGGDDVFGGFGGDEIVYPPSLQTPVFPDIELHLPPADQLFSNIPLAKEAVVEGRSSASSLIPGVVMFALAFLALFF